MSHGPRPDSSVRRWFSTVPALLLLLWAVFNWTANSLSGKMIQVGEDMWQGYAIELRLDRGPPVAPATAAPAAATPGADDDLIGDLLADEEPAVAAPALSASTDGADDDLIGDLLADEDTPPPSVVAAGPTAQDYYEEDLVKYEAAQARLTPTIRAYRWVDTRLGAVSVWGSARTAHLLVLLLLVAGATATATRGHIALRPARTLLDDRVSNAIQLLANGVVVASMVRLWQLNASSGTEVPYAELPLMWAAAFGLMALLNLYNLAKPGADLAPGGNLVQAGLTVPLYCGMAVISFIYFVVAEDYVAGLAVYLQKLTEHAELYVFVGLYVWAGMLLKRTRIAHLSFELLRPWKLPPELLAIVVVLAAAIPTAYSGASGIFVIAVGALIYSELREAGARRGLALAATAMSGSLGVVLRPCLLVVIVAYLNPPTTDVLYGWGRWVFLLTSGLFAIAVLLTRQNKLTMAPIGQALPESLKRFLTMVPYIGVAAVILLAYYFGLDAVLDEHTAPVILPVALFALMAFERIKRPKGQKEERPHDQRPSPLDATSETTTHMGALVLLMSLSIALGGVFERSEIMDLVPQDLGSPWATMSLLVVVLVVIGMTMDPYGAVILVSATVAEVAYRNGIDEAHFWMVVLVAFELGYLTPPVALNHLLTRQVVGPDEVDAADQEGDSFWYRHERILLPVSVMSVALLLVAFVPLLFTSS